MKLAPGMTITLPVYIYADQWLERGASVCGMDMSDIGYDMLGKTEIQFTIPADWPEHIARREYLQKKLDKAEALVKALRADLRAVDGSVDDGTAHGATK